MKTLFQSQMKNLLVLVAISAFCVAAGVLDVGEAGATTLVGMAVSFSTIPNALRVPFVAVEFDNSRSSRGPSLLAYRTLIIGQKLTAGTAVANTLKRVTNADQVATYAGRGSMLHRQALAYFAANKFTETWIGVVADDGAGVAAAGTITVTGPATADGTISLYLGGTLISVAVASGDAATAIAANIAAAITAASDLPVTATALAAVVTVTFRHKGSVGNEFDIRLNYQDGEATPAGVGLAIVAMANGATNPALAGLVAAMGDEWFQVVAHPYTDATSLSSIEAELASRFGPMRMIDGVAFTAKAGSTSTLGTLGDGRNSPHSCILATNGSPTPPMEYAANAAGVVAFHGASDPARPFQTLPLAWCKAPAEADRFTLQERNLLLFDGISTTNVSAGGVVQLERLVTTYQTNAAGAADTSYLDVTTMLSILYARYTFRNRMLAKYPRHKLSDDGTRFGAGQAVITPKIGKAEAVGWFEELEELGIVEGLEQFKADLVVERNAIDRNRLDFLLPPDLVNQFIVGAANIQFRL